MTCSTQISVVHPRGIARWIKDPYCGLSHGLGALAAVVGLVLLLIYSKPIPTAIVGVSIYGASLILLFLASCLAHSIYCSPRADNMLERLDYAAIFFLIVGTYTPICLTTLFGAWGWTLLSIQGGLALIGMIMVLWHGPRRGWVLMYVPMGWMVMVAIWPVITGMDTVSLVLLLVGGIIYSLGAIVFVSKKPRLLPGWFGYHDLWHTMVLAGSACHFVTIARLTT